MKARPLRQAGTAPSWLGPLPVALRGSLSWAGWHPVPAISPMLRGRHHRAGLADAVLYGNEHDATQKQRSPSRRRALWWFLLGPSASLDQERVPIFARDPLGRHTATSPCLAGFRVTILRGHCGPGQRTLARHLSGAAEDIVRRQAKLGHQRPRLIDGVQPALVLQVGDLLFEGCTLGD